jgi:aldehyde:ferredoxin oxidoreductase
VADQDGVRELARWMAQNWKSRSLGMHELGTNGGLEGLSEGGRLPTRNFQDGRFEGAAEIGGEALRTKITIDTGGCYACPVNCKRVCKVDDEDYQVNPEYGGPEYETVGSFGSNCGIDDIRAVAAANELCNAYSVDTISTGMMVSFAMECYENGLLTKEDTGGLDLSFGNAKEMVELTRMICEREGIGDLLAEGPRAAVAKIGPASKPFAIEVKGQPFPMHESRTRHGQSLGYAVSPTGADHMHNIWDGGLANDPPGDGLQAYGNYESVPETVLDANKVRAYTATANWCWFGNALGCCAFLPWSSDQKVELVRTITGWKTDMRELMRIGERSVTLARVFNMREGLGREQDVLPGRMNTYHVTQTINEEPVDPEVLDEAVSLFYGMMGWDPETGAPTDAKLHDLDIAWVKEYQ